MQVNSCHQNVFHFHLSPEKFGSEKCGKEGKKSEKLENLENKKHFLDEIKKNP